MDLSKYPCQRCSAPSDVTILWHDESVNLCLADAVDAILTDETWLMVAS